MLETSKDLLFVVLSFCILWLTVFLCWVIYYVAMLLKQAYTVTKSVQQKLDAFEALMNTIKERVEKSSSHLALVADGISQVVKFFVARKAKTAAESMAEMMAEDDEGEEPAEPVKAKTTKRKTKKR